jgi:hypothetical protein
VFSSVRLGVSPEVNALASLFLAVVFVLVSLAFWLMARQERREVLGENPPARDAGTGRLRARDDMKKY